MFRIFGLINQLLAAVRQIEVYVLHAADTTARPLLYRRSPIREMSPSRAGGWRGGREGTADDRVHERCEEASWKY